MDSVLSIGFQPPFTIEKGKRRRVLRQYSRNTGIYLIRENGRIVYVGMSAYCVVAALYRHFYPWAHDRQGKHRRVTYWDRLETNQYEATIITAPADQCLALEEAIASTITPRDNHIHHHATSVADNLPKQPEPEPQPVDIGNDPF